jgi:hypothetical protein
VLAERGHVDRRPPLLLLLDVGKRVKAGRDLVERLARAHAQEGAARRQDLERRDLLGDDDRVVAVDHGGDGRAKRRLLRDLRGGAQPYPGVARVRGRRIAVLPPRSEVIAAGDDVEAGLFRRLGLAQQLVGGEALMSQADSVHHVIGLAAARPQDALD